MYRNWKRYITVCVFFLVILVCRPFAVYADITTGLVAYWNFDEGSGTTANDTSGNGDNGTLSGSTLPTWVNGQIGGHALSFNGASSYVSIASNPISSFASANSGCAWFYTNDYAYNAGYDVVFSFYADTNNSVVLYTSPSSGSISLGYRVGGSNIGYNTDNIVNNTWTHFCYTYDGATFNYYINGAAAGLGYSTSNTAQANTIGQLGAGEGYWYGKIDDVRVYNRALSAADVAELYAYTGSPAFPSWYLTSSDFWLHPIMTPIAGGSPTYSFSTSTSYKVFGVGGEPGLGTSTSADFGLQSGYMRNIYTSPSPIYEQIHYHWRNDNGSETTATSGTGGTQDTATSSVPQGAIIRLRVEIANHGGTILGYSPQQFGLQYGILSSSCGAITSWNNVGSSTVSSTDWSVANSSNLTSGGNTTNISVATGGVSDTNHSFLTPNGGVVNNNGTTTASVSVPSDSFIELEYALTANSGATTASPYCFRLTNASSTTNYLYTVYPQATVTSSGGGSSLTASIDSLSETFPNLVPGFLVATSSIISVKTTNSSGFNVTVNRVNGTATLLNNANSSITIPDNTAWSPGANCASAGNGVSSSTNPNTLQFRVKQGGTDSGNYCSAWWGTDDTSANALFAGFPTTAKQIVNRSTSSVSTTTATVLYNLNVSSLQQTGTYSGTITYIVTANP